MARGDYDRRVTATSRDEVGELARAFNEMAAELAETDRLRRDLVANVSPRAAHADHRAAGRAREPRRRRRAARPRDAARRCSPRSSGSAGSSPSCSTSPASRRARSRSSGSAFDVEPLLDARGAGAAAARARRRRRRRRRVADDLTADGDPERVHQVVANLLENAVRHTPTGGRVEVRARRCAVGGHHRGAATRAPASPKPETEPGLRTLLPGRSRPRRRATAAPASASPSPAGSSTSTAATSTPSAASRTAAAWSSTLPGAAQLTSDRTEEPLVMTPRPPSTRPSSASGAARWSSSSTTRTARTRATSRWPASWVTPEAINFMLRWARGLVCMPCDGARLDALDIGADGRRRPRGCDTAFTRVDRPPRRRQRHRRRRPGGHDPPDPRPVGPAPTDFVRPGSRVPAAGPPRRRARAPGPHRGRGRPRPPRRAAAGRGDLRGARTTTGRRPGCPFLELFAAEHRIAMISVDQVAEHRLAAADAERATAPLLL